MNLNLLMCVFKPIELIKSSILDCKTKYHGFTRFIRKLIRYLEEEYFALLVLRIFSFDSPIGNVQLHALILASVIIAFIPVVPAPVDGQWSAWSPYSACSKPCQGIKSRSRTCSNPAPAFGGRACSGHAKEDTLCMEGCTSRFFQCLNTFFLFFFHLTQPPIKSLTL